MKTFYLISCHGFGKYWVEKSANGEYFINRNEGRVPTYNATVHKTEIAKSYFELDWNDTYLCEPNSDAGWLDRNGVFYGCPYEYHDDYCYLVLKKSTPEIESAGWVRVENKREFQYMSKIGVSAEQKNWLSFHGYDTKHLEGYL